MKRSQELAAGLIAGLCCLLLLGDYLLLSLSHLLLGVKGNWLAWLQAGQLLALGLVWRLGWLRGARPGLLGVGMLGFCILNLGHGCALLLQGADLGDYGLQKSLQVCLGLGPALLLGIAIGNRARQQGSLPGSALLPLCCLPLLAAAGIAALSDPEALTIARHRNMGVYLGCVVLPVHQALAFAAGKLALYAQARAQTGPRPGLHYLLVAACLLCALVSGSRGYLLAAVLALGLQVYAGGLRPAVLLPLLALPLLPLANLPIPTAAELFDPATLASDSFLERQDVWAAASEAFAAQPLLGLGAGGFAEFLGYPGRVYPHNLLLEVACEYGILGLGCLLLMLLPALGSMAGILLQRRRASEVELFALGLLGFALVGVLGVADLLRNGYFFLALGLCQCCRSPAPAPEPVRLELVRG